MKKKNDTAMSMMLYIEMNTRVSVCFSSEEIVSPDAAEGKYYSDFFVFVFFFFRTALARNPE